jgi:hypothetical protein
MTGLPTTAESVVSEPSKTRRYGGALPSWSMLRLKNLFALSDGPPGLRFPNHVRDGTAIVFRFKARLDLPSIVLRDVVHGRSSVWRNCRRTVEFVGKEVFFSHHALACRST